MIDFTNFKQRKQNRSRKIVKIDAKSLYFYKIK